MPKRGRKIRPGRHWVTDERTGISRWDDKVIRDWDGVVVKKGSEDKRHPQYDVRGLQDPYPISEIRPELGTDFDDVCGFYAMEFIPNTNVKRTLSQNDDSLPLPGIGQMAIGPPSNDCGHLLFIQKPSRILNIPSIIGSNTSFSIPTITHVIDLPDGIDIDNRLIAFFNAEGVVDITWPVGWTVFFSITNSTLSFDIAYLDVDGTEGFAGSDDIITVTTDLIVSSSHLSHRLIDFDSVVAPEASTGAAGTSTSPDPDEITPSSGNTDYLIIAAEAHNTGSTATSPPANYTEQTESKTN